MLRFNSLCTRVFACMVLLLSVGCAQMFNGHLNTLVSETELPIDSPKDGDETTPEVQTDRDSDAPDLSNMKIDPLLFQDRNAVSQTPQPPSIQKPLIDDTTVVVPSYLNPSSTAQRLQPIVDAKIEPVGPVKVPQPRQPIILKAMHVDRGTSKPDTVSPKQSVAHATQTPAMTPDASLHHPTQVLSPQNVVASPTERSNNDFAPQAKPVSASIGQNAPSVSATPNGTSNAVPNSNDFAPVAKSAKTRTPSVIKKTPVAPKPSQPFVPYVSAQMQHLVPPFADHPTIEAKVAVKDHGEQTETSIQSPPSTNDFVSAEPARNPQSTPEASFPALDSSTLLDQMIRDAATQITTNPAVATSESSNQVVSIPKRREQIAPLNWRSQLEQTIEVFEREIEQSAANGQTATDDSLAQSLAVLKALKTRFVDRKSDNPLTESEVHQIQQYWNHQILAINELLDSSQSSAATQAIEHLRSAIGQLRPLADLKIASPALCKKVQGFGQYTPFDQSAFTANQEILVYCEIENFLPVLEAGQGGDRYLTMLSSSFRITNSEGQVVQEQEFPMVSDHARKIRRDFFMYLPIAFANLPTGHYHLQVNVRDHQSSKEAELEQPLTFSIR